MGEIVLLSKSFELFFFRKKIPLVHKFMNKGCRANLRSLWGGISLS